MGICTLEWVCRFFSLVIPIGKSNTPFLRMHSCFVGFEKVPVCVLVSSKSRGPPCGGSPHGVLLRSRLGCWVLISSSGEIIFGKFCTGASVVSCPWTSGVCLLYCWLRLCGWSCCRFELTWEAVRVPLLWGRAVPVWPPYSWWRELPVMLPLRRTLLLWWSRRWWWRLRC